MILLLTTSVAADRASLENELESLIKKANALGVPTREQQKEDPNAWPMEIFIPEQMQKIEANIQTASMSGVETYGIVPMSAAEILEVCCNSVEGLTGFHYTCWGVFTCDGYLSPTSWVTLYTAFDDYFSGENNAALSDVVPFMKIKNTGSANKTIKGDYSIYENSPEWTDDITMYLISPSTGTIYTADYASYGSLPADTFMDSVLDRTL